MKIIIAKTAGFCMGVKRAVDLAVDTASNKKSDIYTIGPLIHNNQTLEMLKARGVKAISKSGVLSENDTIISRAHGITPDTETEFKNKCAVFIDGTCPKVKTVHKVIQKYTKSDYTIVVAGDEGHAEVDALVSYAGPDSFLVQSSDDIKKLPGLPKICLVSQTTFNHKTFDEIADALKKYQSGSEIVIKKTICMATDRRQREARDIASKVDAVIVAGGKNSANTKRLAEICGKIAPITIHVETETEIKWDQIKKCKTIGITAGASTPNWILKRIIDHIQFTEQTHKKSIRNIFWRIFNTLSNLNIFIALGGCSMYYVSCKIQGYAISKRGFFLTFLYLVSMYLWNSLTNIDITKHLGITRYKFYNKYKWPLYAVTVGCITLILLASYNPDKIHLFYLLLFSTLAGSIYHFSFVPKPFHKYFAYNNLKDIPTSRDLFVALAWSTVITFIPQSMGKEYSLSFHNILLFFWVFILAYLRSLMLDLRDIQGDRIMGRETLVTVIGEKSAVRTITFTIITASAVFIIFPFISLLFSRFPVSIEHSAAFAFQIPVLAYIFYLVKNLHKTASYRNAIFNIFADTQFYLAGLCIFLWEMIFQMLIKK